MIHVKILVSIFTTPNVRRINRPPTVNCWANRFPDSEPPIEATKRMRKHHSHEQADRKTRNPAVKG